MGLFKKTDHETQEQQYVRQSAERQAQIARKQANEAHSEAKRYQMDVDIYGREGKWYSDPVKAREAAATRDRYLERRGRHDEAATRQEQIASPPAPKKRGWFS